MQMLQRHFVVIRISSIREHFLKVSVGLQRLFNRNKIVLLAFLYLISVFCVSVPERNMMRILIERRK